VWHVFAVCRLLFRGFVSRNGEAALGSVLLEQLVFTFGLTVRLPPIGSVIVIFRTLGSQS
jgi:hypothetical protein